VAADPRGGIPSGPVPEGRGSPHTPPCLEPRTLPLRDPRVGAIPRARPAPGAHDPEGPDRPDRARGALLPPARAGVRTRAGDRPRSRLPGDRRAVFSGPDPRALAGPLLHTAGRDRRGRAGPGRPAGGAGPRPVRRAWREDHAPGRAGRRGRRGGGQRPRRGSDPGAPRQRLPPRPRQRPGDPLRRPEPSRERALRPRARRRPLFGGGKPAGPGGPDSEAGSRVSQAGERGAGRAAPQGGPNDPARRGDPLRHLYLRARGERGGGGPGSPGRGRRGGADRPESSPRAGAQALRGTGLSPLPGDGVAALSPSPRFGRPLPLSPSEEGRARGWRRRGRREREDRRGLEPGPGRLSGPGHARRAGRGAGGGRSGGPDPGSGRGVRSAEALRVDSAGEERLGPRDRTVAPRWLGRSPGGRVASGWA